MPSNEKQKSLRQVSVVTSPEAEDAVGELLQRVSGLQVSAYTNERTKTSTVSIYCQNAADWNPEKRSRLRAGLRRIKDGGLDPGPAKIRERLVPREDWSESWKRHFKPLQIGRKLLITPSWIKTRPRPGLHVVVLDPGLSFGTGNHPTTEFCLRELVAGRDSGRRQSFLDLGTGSGILAIAAVKLGYGPVQAVDFDPEAVRVARQNARQNQVAGEVHPVRQDLTRVPVQTPRQYDFVCANLISNLLLDQRRKIGHRVKTGGRLVLAGILRGEFPAIQTAYEEIGFELVQSRIRREWRSGSFVKRR